jgi:hypothetical protein
VRLVDCRCAPQKVSCNAAWQGSSKNGFVTGWRAPSNFSPETFLSVISPKILTMTTAQRFIGGIACVREEPIWCHGGYILFFDIHVSLLHKHEASCMGSSARLGQFGLDRLLPRKTPQQDLDASCRGFRKTRIRTLYPHSLAASVLA